MSEEPRSAEARARAEQALVWLVSGFEGAEIDLIVLGGLVPEILTRGVERVSVGHLGTTDVDLLLVTHVDQEEDLGAVETSLTGLGFTPEGDGWRWRRAVGGYGVKIEFLCDLDTVREEELVVPVGCDRLRAVNLRGTGYVARDWRWEELHAAGPEGEPLSVRVRFAGLRGYLLSKSVAVRTRGAAKDYYDFAYVLIHNREGGPRQAAEMLMAGDRARPWRRSVPASLGRRTSRPAVTPNRCCWSTPNSTRRRCGPMPLSQWRSFSRHCRRTAPQLARAKRQFRTTNGSDWALGHDVDLGPVGVHHRRRVLLLTVGERVARTGLIGARRPGSVPGRVGAEPDDACRRPSDAGRVDAR